ncbi:MAG: hypothetical protein JWL94_1995 [Microbacteriaceae bacterium]|jgi:hypothetical protein|nr:hypothetical protein [Microbacteriaceae bacterium]HEV7957468.1 acyl-CoA carboxylase subunit epsilon [Marisediminicola sp.]
MSSERSEPDAAATEIRVLSGDPSSAELAAVTAVIAGMAEEQSDAAGEAPPRGLSAWQRSQAPIRGPLTRGMNTWRGFAG